MINLGWLTFSKDLATHHLILPIILTDSFSFRAGDSG